MATSYRVIFTGDPPVGTLDFVSEACAALIGVAPDDILAHPRLWLDAIHADDREIFVQTTAQLIASGEPSTRHYRVRVSADAYTLVEDRLLASFDASGDVNGYEAVVVKAS